MPYRCGDVRDFILKSLEDSGHVEEEALLRFRYLGAKKISRLKAAGLAIKPSGQKAYRHHTSADRLTYLKHQEAALLDQLGKTQQWIEECRSEMAALMGSEEVLGSAALPQGQKSREFRCAASFRDDDLP